MVRRFRFVKLLLFVLVFTACRKDGVQTPVPPDPVPTEPAPAEQPAWTIYNTLNSKLPDNQVNAIAIGSDNARWIGTANGLVKIVGQEWTVFNATNSGLPSSTINAICVATDGTAWVGTDKGLAQISKQGISTYNTANSKLPVNAIMSLAHDPKNNITWVGTEQGLIQIAASGWTLHDETSGQLILSMAVDSDGALWLGTFHHFSFQGRVKKFYQGTWKSFLLDHYGYASTFPYKVAIDKNNDPIVLLSGTSVSAMARITGGNLQEIPKPASTKGIRAFVLQEDKIWISGSQLSLLTPGIQEVLEIPVKDAGTLSMAIGTDGRKWIGTYSTGLAIYNR